LTVLAAQIIVAKRKTRDKFKPVMFQIQLSARKQVALHVNKITDIT